MTAGAQLTTSIWWPGNIDFYIGYVASVVGKEGDKTTLLLSFDKETNITNLPMPQTAASNYTVAPFSLGMYEVTSIKDVGEQTFRSDCTTRQGAGGDVCTYSTNGRAYWSEFCVDHTETVDLLIKTYRYTMSDSTAPPSVETVIASYNPLTNTYPAWCKSSGYNIPESEATTVVTWPARSAQQHRVVITAGAEKLTATAGATPTSTGPAATGTGKAGDNKGDATRQVAPALVGLGAAVAAFIL